MRYFISKNINSSQFFEEDKINKILIGNKPMICELMLDHNQEQMPKAINRRMPGGKSVATKYEDMYPFLDRKEYQNNMIVKEI